MVHGVVPAAEPNARVMTGREEDFAQAVQPRRFRERRIGRAVNPLADLRADRLFGRTGRDLAGRSGGHHDALNQIGLVRRELARDEVAECVTTTTTLPLRSCSTTAATSAARACMLRFSIGP